MHTVQLGNAASISLITRFENGPRWRYSAISKASFRVTEDIATLSPNI